MRTEQTKKLIDKYEEFRQIFENDYSKSLLRTDILKIYSEINNPNAEDNYTIGLMYYEDYDQNTSKNSLNERTLKAIYFFENSIKADKSFYMSNYYLGHCYQDLQQYQKAIEYYLKVNQEKLKTDFPLWRYVLLFELIGFCYWKIGEKNIGIKYFEKTHSEFLMLQDYSDLIPIGELIEECLGENHCLVIEMKEYAETKNI